MKQKTEESRVYIISIRDLFKAFNIKGKEKDVDLRLNLGSKIHLEIRLPK